MRIAPNHSREVTAASDACTEAMMQHLKVLEVAYPVKSTVRVVHERGSFEGTVTGYMGSRVLVKNDRSGKLQGWWHRQVELINGPPPSAIDSVEPES